MVKFLCVLFLVFWSGGLSAEMRVYKYGEIPNVKELQKVLLQGKVASDEKAESRLGKSKSLNIKIRATTEQKAPLGCSEIALPLLFEKNSYKLHNDQNTMQTLENLSMALQNQNIKLIIEGHTDAIGNKDYNLSLSRHRAATVKDYLLKKGIKDSNLITRGMGFGKPLPGTDPFDAINRRVQFKVMN